MVGWLNGGRRDSVDRKKSSKQEEEQQAGGDGNLKLRRPRDEEKGGQHLVVEGEGVAQGSLTLLNLLGNLSKGGPEPWLRWVQPDRPAKAPFGLEVPHTTNIRQ
jgi:hypothetical protein